MVFTHTPRYKIAVWSLLSYFSIWYDVAYISLRPHTLPGGKWHGPVFKPMVRWAAIDNLYGEQAWNDNDTVLAAKANIGCFEANLHLIYLCHLVRAGGLSWTMGTSRISGRLTAQTVLFGLLAMAIQATKLSFYSTFVVSW